MGRALGFGIPPLLDFRSLLHDLIERGPEAENDGREGDALEGPDLAAHWRFCH